MIQPGDDLGETEMKYGMLGKDDQTTAERLEKYTGEVDWSYLEKHYANGALLWVDPSLILTEVGEAFANDDKKKVSNWKKKGDLIQPTTPHALHWEESNERFVALVVSPFVLIQPVPVPEK